MKFTKMQGIGNDFIFIEDFENNMLDNEIEIAKKVCDRHYGIGADGLIVIRRGNNSNMKMTIINSDGSRANMCGNAIRCFGRYVYDKGYVETKTFNVETDDGVKEITLIEENNKISGARVYMGKPSFEASDIPLVGIDKLINEEVKIGDKEYKLTTLLVGVPHTIIIKEERDFDVEEGALIEKFKYFKEGTNVNFAEVIDRKHINVKTWERGAGATLACGTGTCATVYALNMFDLVDDTVEATLPGGKLTIEIREEGIYMIGNAEYICKGEIL